MSTPPTPGFFRNLGGKADPGVVSAIDLIFKGTKDAHDAIVALSKQHGTTVQNVTNVSTQIGSLTKIINNIEEAVPEGNVNQQTVPYAIQNSDYGGVVILQGAGPYGVTLNSAVSMPYYTFCFNLGSVSATVTPDLAGATINNVASLTLPANQWMLIFFDGLNWWVLSSTVLPSFADDEIPSGAIDGLNTTFVLAHTPNPTASLQLYWQASGGASILLVSGIGNDYTLSGANITTLFTLAIGDKLYAYYRY